MRNEKLIQSMGVPEKGEVRTKSTPGEGETLQMRKQYMERREHLTDSQIEVKVE